MKRETPTNLGCNKAQLESERSPSAHNIIDGPGTLDLARNDQEYHLGTGDQIDMG